MNGINEQYQIASRHYSYKAYSNASLAGMWEMDMQRLRSMLVAANTYGENWDWQLEADDLRKQANSHMRAIRSWIKSSETILKLEESSLAFAKANPIHNDHRDSERVARERRSIELSKAILAEQQAKLEAMTAIRDELRDGIRANVARYGKA